MRFAFFLPACALVAAALVACDDPSATSKAKHSKDDDSSTPGDGGGGAGPELPPEPTTHFEGFASGWAVPEGGQYLAGFNDLAGEPGQADDVAMGAQRWRLVDLDGDGRSEIVVPATAVPRDGYYYWNEVPGYAEQKPFWYVYGNDGKGFATGPAAWPVPLGGQHLAGFNDLSGEPGQSDDVSMGSQRWRLLDIDGDGRPDLVVTATAAPRDGYYYWNEVPGYAEQKPFWYVYKNNGAGFDAGPIAWPVPVGGKHMAGFNDVSGEPGEADDVSMGSQRWRMLDVDGDGRSDLVVTATAVPRDGYYYWSEVPGFVDGAPFWYVFRNNGGGFDAGPIAWKLPVGGKHLAGFNDLSGEPGEGDDVSMGAQRWRVVDINSDGRPDLVVTGEAVARDGYYYWVQVPGFGQAPAWQVHLGVDGGFEGAAQSWPVPAGGQHLAGFADLGGEPGQSDDVEMGADRWRLTDVDGDHRLDIVVTGDAVPRDGYYFWVAVPGFGTAPRWQIYRGAP